MFSSTTVNGVRIAYRDEGAGDPPLLFVHGWCCDHTYWQPQIAGLSPRHRTIAPDLAGFGASDRAQRPYEVRRFASEVLALADALSLDQPVLIGHSLGALIAYVAASIAPERVRGLVLLDPSIAPVTPPQELATAFLAFANSLRGENYREILSGFISGALVSEDSPLEVRAKLLAEMPQTDQEVMASSFEDMVETVSKLPDIAPVPGVWVSSSRPNPALAPGGVAALRPAVEARWPFFRFVEVPGTAHFVQLEAPDRVNAIIREFCEGPDLTP